MPPPPPSQPLIEKMDVMANFISLAFVRYANPIEENPESEK